MPNIRGVVLNAHSLKPLSHARVWIDAPPFGVKMHITTGDNGSFELRDLKPGTYTLRAQADSIQIGRFGYSFSGALEGLQLGDTDTTCEIQVNVAGILQGQVKDALEGKTIRGATVQTAEETGGLYMSVTDEEGIFSLSHIKPQSYNVFAQALGYEQFRQRVFVGDALEDGPVTLPIFLTPIPVPMSAGGIVRGFVLNEMGNPATGAEITLAGEHERRSMITFKDYFDLQNGNYEFFDVPEGRYEVIALKAGMQPGKVELKVERGKANWPADIRLSALPINVPPELEYLVIEPRTLMAGHAVEIRLKFRGPWTKSAVASATLFGPGGMSFGFSFGRDEETEELSRTFPQWEQAGTFVLSQLLVFDTDTGKAFHLNVQAQFEVVPKHVPPLTPESPIFSANR